MNEIDEKNKVALEKQLQLLSERSQNANVDLVGLTHAMCEIVAALIVLRNS